MKLIQGKVRVAVATLVVGLLAFATTALNAAEVTSSATVEIIANLTIVESVPLDFGTIGKPSAGTDSFDLSHADNTVTKTTANDGFHVDGTSTAGVYDISGNNDVNVDLQAFIDTDFADPALSLTALDIEGTGSTHTVLLDGTGAGQVRVGGTVDVGDAAAEGVHTADIRITANYQ